MRLWKLCFIFGCLAILSVQPAVAQVTYNSTDSVEIEGLLNSVSGMPGNVNLPLHFARHFVGRPYVAHTLEVNDKEQLVVNTRQLDCTTLVETVTALTLCAKQHKYSFGDYTSMLRSLRYRGGNCEDYTSRLHYFTDWILDNCSMKMVREIQGPVPPFSATQRINVNYMSTHPDAYKALKDNPKYVSTIQQQEKSLTGRVFRYIPASAVDNSELLRKTIHDGDIIAITCNKKGLDIAHLGFAIWQSDGLHLLNASSIHHKVVEETMTLSQYLKMHPTFTGIRIIRI